VQELHQQKFRNIYSISVSERALEQGFMVLPDSTNFINEVGNRS